MGRDTLTQSRLHELLDYDPISGVFRIRVYRGGPKKKGDVAGSLTNQGYRQIRVDGGRYKAHRLAWLYMYGKWPCGYIDHIDGNPSNNAIANLRDVDRTGNARNSRTPKSNTSGYLGVAKHTQYAKWRAYIRHDGKVVHLGMFKTAEEAAGARKAADAEYGYHSNHGRSEEST